MSILNIRNAFLKKQTKQPNKKNQTYIRKKAQKTHAQLKRVTKKPTKHVKQRLKKPDLLKTPLAANSSAPTWFTDRVSGLQPHFF
jgi:phosphoglycerol transferase MdoB-like AlkP superfamily enzyme